MKHHRSTSTEKWCPDCKVYLPHSFFGSNRANFGGLASICRECRKVRLKKRDRTRATTGLPPQSEETRIRKKAYRHRIRKELIAFFGGRCNSPDCKTINEDGTKGCTDERCLQLDHINGGGKKEYTTLNHSTSLYNKVMKDKTGYQLLCANCNWIKRSTHNELRIKIMSA
jgi:hypothetical protein